MCLFHWLESWDEWNLWVIASVTCIDLYVYIRPDNLRHLGSCAFHDNDIVLFVILFYNNYLIFVYSHTLRATKSCSGLCSNSGSISWTLRTLLTSPPQQPRLIARSRAMDSFLRWSSHCHLFQYDLDMFLYRVTCLLKCKRKHSDQVWNLILCDPYPLLTFHCYVKCKRRVVTRFATSY